MIMLKLIVISNMKKSQSKVLKVLIPNATSPKNPGDQAMLSVLIGLIKQVHRKAVITVHTTDPQLYTNSAVKINHTLYSWSVFENRSVLVRFVRLMKLLMQYVFLRIGVNHTIADKTLSQLVADYTNADLILFVGGGYLHSKKGLKQSLNVLMQAFLFKFASVFEAKKIVAPISVGPFGYAWHETIAMSALRAMDMVALREKFSFSLTQKHGLKNAVLAADHALLTYTKNNTKRKNPQKALVVGFTIRKWLQESKQAHLEASVLSALEKFALKTGASIQPIIQVDAPEYGEDDIAVTARITQALKKRSITVLPTKKVKDVLNAVTIYSDIDLLLGMRMHSNIIAATQGTPFVAISYEYKTEGIAEQLAMKKYCISCEKITSKNLYSLLIDVYTKRKSLRKKLGETVATIQHKETIQWGSYLSL
jgi:colanic acid/amylovoran biosynthesis protein